MKTYPLMSLSNMARKVIHRNILLTIGTICLLAKMNALNVIIQEFLCLKLLLTVGTLVVSDLLMEILDMVIQIFVLLVTDVTSGCLGQVNLFNVVLQSIFSDKLLFTQRTLSHLQ